MTTGTSERILASALLVLGAACGGDDSGEGDGDDGGQVDSGPPPDLWLVQATVETADGRTSYVQTVPSIDVDAIGNEEAVEIAGNGRVYFHDPALVFLGGSESPEATRFTIEDDGALTPGDAVSFASAGFNFLPYGNTFASAERAFLLDGLSLAGMVWNPAEGTIGDFLDLSSLAREGFEVTTDPGIVRGDRLFVPLQYSNPASLDIFPGVAVAVLDVESAAVLAVLTDERCIGGYTGLKAAEDGTIYIVGDGYAGLTRFLNQASPATCLLRILPGEETIDTEWVLPLPDALGGRDGVSLIYGGDGIAFAAALYPERVQVEPFDVFGFLGEEAARWWRIDLATGAGTELDVPYHTIAQSTGYVEGGRVFLAAPEAGYVGDTELFEVDPETGAVTARARFSGYLTELEHVARE